MTSYPNTGSRTLSDAHRRMVYAESGIDPGVSRERGYYTARKRSEVPEAFKDYQKRPGLIIPVLTPAGERRVRLRPDRPRKGKDGRVRKYEQAGGVCCVLDVHPRNLKRLRDPAVPLWVVEGEKKGDALTSRGECAIALPGVWNFQRSGEMLPDWDYVALSGRLLYVCFDSDAWSNPNVQMALERLVAALETREAKVLVVHLEDNPDGSKVGADDHLAAGGTVDELKLRARTFVPEDIGQSRLSKDEKLRAAVKDLERQHAAADWTAPGGDADEDLYLTLAAHAAKHGTVLPEGVRVVVSWGTLQLEAKIGSSRTVGKGLARLEERGLLYRDTTGSKEGKPGAFVLKACAGVKHMGGSEAHGGQGTTLLQRYDRSTLHPRSPRLWASRPKFKPTKKMIREHRLGKLSRLPEPREGVKRLGKRRSHVFDRLDAAGGTLALEELGRLVGARPRDLTRRKRTEKGRDGLLIWPEEAGIITIDDGRVSLTPDWLDRLEDQRERGEEIEADKLAKNERKRRSLAYRDHLEKRRCKPRKSEQSAASLEARQRSREAKTAGLAAERERAAAAAKSEEQRRAEAFVQDRLRELGRVRLGLLQDIWRDEGGDSWTIPKAVEALECPVEELPEYGNRKFVFAPMEDVA
jgi:predicted RNA-binding protein with RPS1 domain